MIQSPLLFGRKLRRDPRMGSRLLTLGLSDADFRQFGYAFMGGLVFFGTYLG